MTRLGTALVILLVCATCLPASLPGQEPEPFARTGDLFVTDAQTNHYMIWRLQDLDQDGDYDDAGEVITFYDGLTGPVAAPGFHDVTMGPDGTLYASTGIAKTVLTFRDINGDGDAMDAGEAQLFYDGNPGGNLEGLTFSSAFRLSVSQNGEVWLAAFSNNSPPGVTGILRLQDVGGDGSANGLSESQPYAFLDQLLFGTDGRPLDVVISPGGTMYYSEINHNAFSGRGIYRLHDDVVNDGVIQVPSEVSPYFLDPTVAIRGFCIDTQGIMWLADDGNDTIWRLEDLNGDQVISPGTAEAIQSWVGAFNRLEDIASASDGSLYVADSSPDQILRLAEVGTPDGDFMDPGEAVAVYSEFTNPTNIRSPLGVALARAPTLDAPAMPPLNSGWQLTLDAPRDQPFSLWVSDTPTMISVPPYGILGIDLTPPAMAEMVFGANVGPSGRYTLGFPPLASVLMPGFTVHVQALAGPAARMELSNTLTLTFLP